nr:helix-turn-helix transcriptional regulator [Leptospira noguchii]
MMSNFVLTNLSQYIADQIKSLREGHNGGKGISQTDLAKHVSKNPNTISRWETGEYKPKSDDLFLLSKFFQVPISSFFPEENQENYNNLISNLKEKLSRKDIKEIINFIEFKIATKSTDIERKKPGRTRKQKSI